MEKIEDLAKKVNHLEYEEIKEIKEDINNIKIDLGKNNMLTKQSIESSNKLSETLDIMKETMIKLSTGIEQSNHISGELSNKVTKLEEKVDLIEEKTKFDIMLFIKHNWAVIVASIGVLSYLFLK